MFSCFVFYVLCVNVLALPRPRCSNLTCFAYLLQQSSKSGQLKELQMHQMQDDRVIRLQQIEIMSLKEKLRDLAVGPSASVPMIRAGNALTSLAGHPDGAYAPASGMDPALGFSPLALPFPASSANPELAVQRAQPLYEAECGSVSSAITDVTGVSKLRQSAVIFQRASDLTLERLTCS